MCDTETKSAISQDHDSEKTAKSAELAEHTFLRVLCGLRGFFRERRDQDLARICAEMRAISTSSFSRSASY